MQPVYVTTTSSGPTAWKVVDWYVTPINIGFSVTQNSSTAWQVEFTLDDPTRTYPHPTLPASAPVSVVVSTIAGSSTNLTGSITTPIAAWRLNVTALSSAGATVTATALQAGI